VSCLRGVDVGFSPLFQRLLLATTIVSPTPLTHGRPTALLQQDFHIVFQAFTLFAPLPSLDAFLILPSAEQFRFCLVNGLLSPSSLHCIQSGWKPTVLLLFYIPVEVADFLFPSSLKPPVTTEEAPLILIPSRWFQRLDRFLILLRPLPLAKSPS